MSNAILSRLAAMPVAHVVYFSSAGCALWSWSRTRFVENSVRVPPGADLAPLVGELLRQPAGPVAVLVDVTDEEHLRETVPRLGSRDQRAVLERKLGRAFPRTRFRRAEVQGRNPANPEEDRVLMSALTRPEPLRLLLQQLSDARLPVCGVFTPALLTGRLLDAEARAAPATLVVLRRRNGRLQHSFFRNGRLCGSRRLRAGAPGLEDGGLMARQMEESLRYFEPTFTASADQPLQVLAAPADLALLGEAEGRNEHWRLRALDMAELRQRLRLAAGIGAGESERLFIELLRHPPAAGLAPPAERRYFGLFRLRSYGKVACLALAGLALAGTLRNALYILDAGQRVTDSAAAVAQLSAVLPAESGAGGLPVDPLEMRQVVSAYEALAREQSDPAAILAAIGAAVSQRPRIQLDALEWAVAAPVEAAQAEDTEAGAPAPADGVRVTLRGRVAPFDGDYPQAFDEVAAFMDALRQDPGVESVTPTAQPLDVSPDSTLTGELASGRGEPEAPFTLLVIMRHGDEPA